MKANIKTALHSVLSVVIVLTCVLGLAACGNEVQKTGLWENALYTKDTTLGSGKKTVTVEVEAEEDKITFTVKTDAETLGDALLENKLVEGDEGQYGLFVTSVNGIKADYSADGSYWAFYIGDEYATTGIDGEKLGDGSDTVYRLVYTK